METYLSTATTIQTHTDFSPELIRTIDTNLSNNKKTQGYHVCTTSEHIQEHTKTIAQTSSNTQIPFKHRSFELFDKALIKLIVQNTQGKLAGCLFAFEHTHALGIPGCTAYEVGGAYTPISEQGKSINSILSRNLRKYLGNHHIPSYALSHSPHIHQKRVKAGRNHLAFDQIKRLYPMVYAHLIDGRNDTYALGVSPSLQMLMIQNQ